MKWKNGKVVKNFFPPIPPFQFSFAVAKKQILNKTLIFSFRKI